MNDAHPLTDENGFTPFRYRGWNFLCSAIGDEDGHFWSVVMCELVWPSGMPVFLIQPSHPRNTKASALVQAQVQAMRWVDERTAPLHLLVR